MHIFLGSVPKFWEQTEGSGGCPPDSPLCFPKIWDAPIFLLSSLCGFSDPAPTLAIRQRTGDEMGGTKRFRDVAI